MTGEYKLLNCTEKNNQRLAEDISENRKKANLNNLKENIKKLAFGVWFAFLLLLLLLLIQFNLFLVLHYKKVHQNTDIVFPSYVCKTREVYKSKNKRT